MLHDPHSLEATQNRPCEDDAYPICEGCCQTSQKPDPLTTTKSQVSRNLSTTLFKFLGPSLLGMRMPWKRLVWTASCGWLPGWANICARKNEPLDRNKMEVVETMCVNMFQQGAGLEVAAPENKPYLPAQTQAPPARPPRHMPHGAAAKRKQS